jgi:hypothetical protein
VEKHWFLSLSSLVFFVGCASIDENTEAKLHGNIAYPFVTYPGVNGEEHSFSEPLIIRSISAGHEYVLEVPGGGEDYDIEIPLDTAGPNNGKSGFRGGRNSNPVKTDQEQLRGMPAVASVDPKDSALVDKAFGVAAEEATTQGPSYTLGLANINQLYKDKNYEYALIELNNLLISYPQSAQLYKMKGSLYLKTGNLALAQTAWEKALELSPSDRQLQASLKNLRQRTGSK